LNCGWEDKEFGGAVHVHSTRIHFSRCIFENCVAENGGAVALALSEGKSSIASAHFYLCHFIHNRVRIVLFFLILNIVGFFFF